MKKRNTKKVSIYPKGVSTGSPDLSSRPVGRCISPDKRNR